ncbi:MAG: hypothetical protein FJX76_04430 [Armatimonadetes bacterium]|nr:hypothetical protein [Armatimonadota bacterium]
MQTAAYDLKHRAQKGQERAYACRTRIEQRVLGDDGPMASQEASWDSRILARTLAVDDDGSRHVVHVMEPVSVTPEGAAQGIAPERQVSYDQVDERGRIIESTNDGALCLYLLPDVPVAPGDTWTSALKLRLPLLGHPVECIHHYRVGDITSVRGHDCLEIGFESEEAVVEAELPIGEQMLLTIKTEGVLCFSPEGGFPVTLQMRIHTRPRVAGVTYETITDTVQELESIRP